MFTDIRLKTKQKRHAKKWKEFYQKEDEVLEFIIRDFRKKCPEDKTSHQEVKNELKTRYTFQRLCAKVDKIMKQRNEAPVSEP